jgi:hypothetical protein
MDPNLGISVRSLSIPREVTSIAKPDKTFSANMSHMFKSTQPKVSIYRDQEKRQRLLHGDR